MRLKNFIKNIYFPLFTSHKPKVFCISIQRNGTTSVGRFLIDHGYRVATYGTHSKMWSKLWEEGKLNKIIHSLEFKSYQAYEDNPWWFPDFYKFLFAEFPNAKFILLTRDSDKWFDSLTKHKSIRQTINTYRHNKVYNKMDLFFDRVENDPLFNPDILGADQQIPFDSMRKHYIKVYENYNKDVQYFFKKYSPNSLFVADLTDNEKWVKMGDFLNIKVKNDYNVHVNKSDERL